MNSLQVVGGNSHKIPFPTRLKRSGDTLDVKRVSEFPGWAKYAVRYANSFKYFEVFKSNRMENRNGKQIG